MNACQYPYYELWVSLSEYRGQAVLHEVLLPWISGHGDELVWVQEFGKRRGDPVPPATEEDLSRLYALSRVLQVLELSFQPGVACQEPWQCEISGDDYEEFAVGLGLRPVSDLPFHPFHHETVSVWGLSTIGVVSVRQELWPTTFLGDMLFHRGGCVVTGARGQVEPGLADRTTLYWAYVRRYCPCQDLSQGWGNNSQWRTSFRRDYAANGMYRYNVDGSQDVLIETPDRVDDNLTAAQRLELLRHRRFVSFTCEHNSLFPYNETYTEAQPGRSNEPPPR